MYVCTQTGAMAAPHGRWRRLVYWCVGDNIKYKWVVSAWAAGAARSVGMHLAISRGSPDISEAFLCSSGLWWGWLLFCHALTCATWAFVCCVRIALWKVSLRLSRATWTRYQGSWNSRRDCGGKVWWRIRASYSRTRWIAQYLLCLSYL